MGNDLSTVPVSTLFNLVSLVGCVRAVKAMRSRQYKNENLTALLPVYEAFIHTSFTRSFTAPSDGIIHLGKMCIMR